MLCINTLSSCSDTSVDYSEALKQKIQSSLKNNTTISFQLNLSDTLTVPVSINTTSKGNGTINLNGLLLRVFDQHDDGIVYKNGYLDLKTKDMNADGISELIISGYLKHTGEKETDPVSFESITNTFSLNCETGYFEKAQSNTDYSIELMDSQKTPIQCIK